MKKILIIADSLAMPRGEVMYEQTWPYLLQRKSSNYHIIDKTRRASTSDRLINEGGGYKNIKKGADLLEHYTPDIVILQIGITDCSPRYFKRISFTALLLRIAPKIVKKFIYRIIKKNCVRKPNHSYTSPSVFQQEVEEYILRAKTNNTKIIIIGVLPATTSFIEKSPHIENAIEGHNNVFKNLEKKYDNVFLIEPISKHIVNDVTVDELHVGVNGHKIIYDKLVNVL